MDPDASFLPSLDDAMARRLPGEQVLALPSEAVAEAYLNQLSPDAARTVRRRPWPNPAGLWAECVYRDRITVDRIYVVGESSESVAENHPL